MGKKKIAPIVLLAVFTGIVVWFGNQTDSGHNEVATSEPKEPPKQEDVVVIPSESNEPETAENEPPKEQTPTELDSSWDPYLDLLTGKQVFYDVVTQKEYYLTDVHDAITPDKSVQIMPEYVSKVDLDGDGVDEIVIDIYTQSIFFGSIILDYQDDGRIYGHQFSQREMGNIKEDGTFESSGSAFNVEIRSISFDREKEIIKTIAKSDIENDNLVFYIEDSSVSMNEFEDYFNRWQKMEDINYLSIDLF